MKEINKKKKSGLPAMLSGTASEFLQGMVHCLIAGTAAASIHSFVPSDTGCFPSKKREIRAKQRGMVLNNPLPCLIFPFF